MRLKCLKSFAGTKFSGTVGEVKSFPDDIAADLIRAGYAVKADEEKVKSDESKRDNDSSDRPTAKGGRKRAVSK